MIPWVNSLCCNEPSKIYSLLFWFCTVAAAAAGALTETQGNICSTGYSISVDLWWCSHKCQRHVTDSTAAQNDAHSELHEGINERSCRVSEPCPTCVYTGMVEEFPNKVKKKEKLRGHFRGVSCWVLLLIFFLQALHKCLDLVLL